MEGVTEVLGSRAASPRSTQPEGAPPSARGFGHRRALDGIRGLAVLLVVFFHAGFGWAIGGWLGVSLFLTLSGFLITSLAIDEVARTGRFAIVAFWGRRLRRLVPALLVAVVLTVVLVASFGTVVSRRALLGDVGATLGYFANWRQISSGTSYAELFSTPSPFVHMWSLAVEEQFYLVFPLVAAVALRRSRWALGAAAAATALIGAALPTVMHFSTDRAYYGTDVRVGEIALGVIAAVLLARVAPRPARRLAIPVALASTIALGALIAAAATMRQTASIWRHGGLTAFAIVSVLVVSAAALDVGPVAAIGRLRVLRRLGKVSYGLYLYHWPIFWLLRVRTDLDPTARFALGFAIAYTFAEISLAVIETPVRNGQLLRARRVGRVELGERSTATDGRVGRVPRRRIAGAFAAVVLIVGVIMSTAALVTGAQAPAIDFEAAAARVERRLANTGGPRPESELERTYAFFGDSTGTMLADSNGAGQARAVGSVEVMHFQQVQGNTQLGCGLLNPPSGTGTRGPNAEYKIDDRCLDWRERWRTAVDQYRPDFAIVSVGPWEVWDFRVPGSTTWKHLGDPDFDAWALTQLRDAADVLSANGAAVVFLTPPSLARRDLSAGACGCDDRLSRFATLERQIARERPGAVTVVDLASYFRSVGTRDEVLRPDGIHVTVATGGAVGQEFLFPQLAAIASR